MSWLESVYVDEDTGYVPVIFEGREGSQVFVRHLDPCDEVPTERIPLYEGDEPMLMTPVAASSAHTTSEIGRIDDLILSQRVVLVRREPGVVYVRSMRHNEPDDGRRVHVRPGDQVCFEPGSWVVELDGIDAAAAKNTTGYVPLSPVLATWFYIGEHDEAKVRYLFAAARRLDAANVLLATVQQLRDELEAADLDKLPGPQIRQRLWALVGAAELAVVGLGRVCDMVIKAADKIGATQALPAAIDSRREAVMSIRHALEHVEERAIGEAFNKPDPVALTIFKHEELFHYGRIVYGDLAMDFADDVPEFIEAARSYLKAVAANA